METHYILHMSKKASLNAGWDRDVSSRFVALAASLLKHIENIHIIF